MTEGNTRLPIGLHGRGGGGGGGLGGVANALPVSVLNAVIAAFLSSDRFHGPS